MDGALSAATPQKIAKYIRANLEHARAMRARDDAIVAEEAACAELNVCDRLMREDVLFDLKDLAKRGSVHVNMRVDGTLWTVRVQPGGSTLCRAVDAGEDSDGGT